MGRYILTRVIDAAPSQVFKAFTDPRLNADWMSASRVQGSTGPLDVVGTRYTLVIKGPWRFRVTVVRSEPPTIHETTMRGWLGASARMVAELSEHEGKTALALTTEYTVPFGPIGRWLDRRFIDREPRTIANREVDRLVTIVSTAAS